MHTLEAQFDRVWPARAWRDSHVVFAVSAGPDSVAMLRAAVALRQRDQVAGAGQIHVAHFNHGLRGAEADADAAWLRSLCGRLALPLEIGQADVAALADQQGSGIEATARTARYAFLRNAAERLGARYVALAHTADDQAETVLHRILRGTGLDGLAGIPAVRALSPSVAIVRPILSARRSEVLDYLNSIGQEYRIDSSNLDLRWTRNRLRHELLPHLRSGYNARVEESLIRLATQAAEAQQLIAELADRLARDCVEVESAGPPLAGSPHMAGRVWIDCRHLADRSPLVNREVCKLAWQRAGWPQQQMGFEQWQQLAALVQAAHAPPPVTFPGNIRVRREEHLLVLESGGLA